MKPEGMTIIELRDYVNSLEGEELDKYLTELDLSDFDADLDPLDLLKASKKYDYIQWKHGGNATVEF